MPKLPHYHLHRLLIGDKALPLVVNARSLAAARDHFIERHLKVERMTPEEAFKAGGEGAVFETAGAATDPADAAPSESAEEPGLFDAPASMPASSAAQAAGATPRPIEGCGPGYAAAMTEASTL